MENKSENNQINWKEKPIQTPVWDENANLILFIDENGHSNLKGIIDSVACNKNIDEGERYFNLCSTLISKQNHTEITKSFVNIKHNYWDEGKFLYPDGKQKVVIFHSDEIRKQIGPFSKNSINQEAFFVDLNKVMSKMEILIFDCFINKESLYTKYNDLAEDPYSLGIKFILERVLCNVKDDDKIMIVLESRGQKEDKLVLETIKLLMLSGTYYVSSKKFNKITGVYFNKKRSKNDDKAYIGLEVVDLCAYPIYKYCKYNKKDEPFCIIESKIFGYPSYFGRGLKIFP